MSKNHENVYNIVSTAAKLGNIVGKTLEDHKVNFGDIMRVPELISAAFALSNIRWGEVLPEVKELTTAERLQLIEHFKTEFNIADKDIEVKIENVLDLINTLVNTFKNLANIYQRK